MELSDALRGKSQQVLDAARRKGCKIALAESCTGGQLALCLTEAAGASEVFLGSAVTYSNHAKHEVLGVLSETLEQYGAVSEQTAREMAFGAKARFEADVTASVTGIAGPGGGSAAKPVGTVHIAACTPAGESLHRHCRFDGDRKAVRAQATEAALDLLLEAMG